MFKLPSVTAVPSRFGAAVCSRQVGIKTPHALPHLDALFFHSHITPPTTQTQSGLAHGTRKTTSNEVCVSSSMNHKAADAEPQTGAI
jgi:hypothetical protein